MEYILIFTFMTMAGLPDEQMLIMDNIDNRKQCMAVAPEIVKQWGSLAEIEMHDVQIIDCLPMGKET